MKHWELLRIRLTKEELFNENTTKKYLNEGWEPFTVSIEPGANIYEVIWLKREVNDGS